jgi:hypothetical protein
VTIRRLGALVVAALAVVACSGGSGGSGGERHELSKADARAVADRAQLTVRDLGDGWTLTSDVAPDEAKTDEQLEACVGADLGAADDTLAQSHTRTFARSAEDGSQQTVVGSGAVLASPQAAQRLFRTIATQRFADCTATSYGQQLEATDDGVTFEAGAVTVRRGEVAGAERSAHIRAPFRLTVDGQPAEGQLDLLVVSSGQVFSLVYRSGTGAGGTDAALTHLGDVLARRQKA